MKDWRAEATFSSQPNGGSTETALDRDISGAVSVERGPQGIRPGRQDIDDGAQQAGDTAELAEWLGGYHLGSNGEEAELAPGGAKILQGLYLDTAGAQNRT
jgi:hypothetical protein